MQQQEFKLSNVNASFAKNVDEFIIFRVNFTPKLNFSLYLYEKGENITLATLLFSIFTAFSKLFCNLP